MSLPQPWIEARGRATPHALALVDGKLRLSWSELAGRARALAAVLQRQGVRPQDVVGLLVENGAPFVMLVHALASCGAILLPLGTRLTAEELALPLATAPARWLVHGDGALETRAREAVRRSADLRGLAVAELLAEAESATRAWPARVAASLEAPLAVVYTSGTSGRPKGAELSSRNFLWSALGWAMRIGAQPSDRWLACLPLVHVGGLGILVRSVLFGAAVCVEPRFDAERVAEQLRAGHITLLSLVPTMLSRLLDAWGDRAAPTSLRCVLLGGGPIPVALLARGLAGGWPLAPTYGLTEAASQVTTLAPEECVVGRGAGRPLLPTRVRIVGAHGETCAVGEAGGIEIAGPTVMRGYRADPPATARALRDGWLHTGDFGSLDAEGHLHVRARRTDLVVSGGENVDPVEVESVLLTHPAVAEAGVAPLPDPELGQRVAAWVVLRPGAAADPATLQRFCRTRLAGFKLPRTIRFVPALPHGPTGKLLRAALRDLAGPGDANS